MKQREIYNIVRNHMTDDAFEALVTCAQAYQLIGGRADIMDFVTFCRTIREQRYENHIDWTTLALKCPDLQPFKD